jgi:hypothetical protein
MAPAVRPIAPRSVAASPPPPPPFGDLLDRLDAPARDSAREQHIYSDRVRWDGPSSESSARLSHIQ